MNMKAGDKFRIARERAGLSQGQVAQYAETGQGYISDIELNKRWPSTWDLLRKLALRYRVSADYLLDIGRNVSLEGQTAGELIDSLPPEKRAITVGVLRAIIELMEVGVPLPEPVDARDGGGVATRARTSTTSAPTWDVGVDTSNHRQLGLPDMEDDEWTSIRKDALLALLKKALPADEFEKLKASVDAGRPLSESELFRLRQILGNTGLKQFFKLPDDNGTISDG